MLTAQDVGEVSDNKRGMNIVFGDFNADDSGKRNVNIEGLGNSIGNFTHNGLLLDVNHVADGLIDFPKADARLIDKKENSVDETGKAAKVGANAAFKNESGSVVAESEGIWKGKGIHRESTEGEEKGLEKSVNSLT